MAGIIEMPDEPSGFAVYAHCFTCGKDLKAAVRISRHMAEYPDAQKQMAVLRFDMTGIGDSRGDFSNTNLTTNCQDIQAACQFLEQEYRAAVLLMGHSLGGTAMTLVADQIESVQALVTLASPSSTERLAGYLSKTNPAIESKGEGEVVIGGRTFLLRKQLLDDLRSHSTEQALQHLQTPILMFHSPQDETLPYDWGLKMFEVAGGTKSFVTLDGSDHLFVEQESDTKFIADTSIVWANRYLS